MREENQSYQDKMMGKEKELNVVDYTQDNSNSRYENQSIFWLLRRIATSLIIDWIYSSWLE